MSGRADGLGEEIMSLAADMLCLDMRFLVQSVISLDVDVVPGSGRPVIGNGRVTFFEESVIADYRECNNLPARQLAHCAFHLLLGHSGDEVSDAVSLAEDIVVEYVLDSLDTPHTAIPGRDERMYACERSFKRAGAPVPMLMEGHVSSLREWERGSYESMFRRDDPAFRAPADDGRWAEMAQQAMAETEGFIRKTGEGSNALLSVLRIRNRRRYDYRGFLRKFMSRGTAVGEDPAEFDPIYYTYGLSTYGNMPLVDSLESSERRMLKEFVIAVDTSGSTMRESVETFLEETFSALMLSCDGKGSRLHVIQCDDMVRRDDVVGSKEDISELMSGFKLEGGGGTDFRPVFRYVDELIENGDLKNLKGLMYFTDGLGTYPEKKPRYDTVFVFCDDRCRSHEVPPWAMKLEVTTAELRGFGGTP
ncbi:MAG: hypothetical protein IKP53_01780 [Candidatus Methanomethylophilaceae archaeon]|nr:hypothetical protein [Candidatus Methanomethylophilaceae archaeon]